MVNLCFLWLGCTEPLPDRSSALPTNKSDNSSDSLSLSNFYKQLSSLSGKARDSVYEARLKWLEQNNRFREIITLSTIHKSNSMPVTSLLITATAYQNIGEYDSSLQLLTPILPDFEKNNQHRVLGQLYRGIGASYQGLKQFPTSVDYFYKSMEAFNAIPDQQESNLSKVELATVFFFLKDFKKSLDLHRQVYDYFVSVPDTLQMAYALDGITVALNNLDSLEAAGISGRKSLELYRAKGDLRGMSVSLNNLAHLYKRHGMLAQAEPFLREGLQLMEKSGDQRYIPVCQSNLGNCLLELNKLDEAEAFLLQSKVGLQPFNEPREIANVELALAKLYQRKGQTDQALLHRIEFDRLKDTLNTRERMRILAESGERYENKVKEAEIERLRHKSEIDQARQGFVALGSFAFLLVVGVWLWSKYKRERAVFEKEKEILTEKGRTQEAELKLARTELVSFAQNIHEKTRLLDELQSKFESSPESFSNPETTYLYLADLHNQRILTEDDWEQFKSQFDKVYPGFSSKIKMNYPEISQAELRLVLLLKLNLETREIAATLGVSPDTVKKTRQRLRRRLGLSEDDKLEDLVRGL
jgi:tetratricopeptide (TPR) repeat protein